ncbi:uncharacterized protein A4U43_C07F37500 [Asparagus officinalis]|uniref:Uncharacterized protein n=1 Tax=Asparagus officinalis TaxID=4686 RepID=A0A5P1EHX5_ASPOF|nr:uncharacterized protein A4U43_C07F37500 [Asparagus officinalis]
MEPPVQQREPGGRPRRWDVLRSSRTYLHRRVPRGEEGSTHHPAQAPAFHVLCVEGRGGDGEHARQRVGRAAGSKEQHGASAGSEGGGDPGVPGSWRVCRRSLRYGGSRGPDCRGGGAGCGVPRDGEGLGRPQEGEAGFVDEKPGSTKGPQGGMGGNGTGGAVEGACWLKKKPERGGGGF